MLKDAFGVDGFFFVQIIKEKFICGEVPSSWKVSAVIPLPKVRNTNKACNFRPIKVLLISEKLMECTRVEILIVLKLFSTSKIGYRYRRFRT